MFYVLPNIVPSHCFWQHQGAVRIKSGAAVTKHLLQCSLNPVHAFPQRALIRLHSEEKKGKSEERKW